MQPVTISLEPEMLATIDGTAQMNGLSRSRFIQDVIAEYLEPSKTASEVTALNNELESARALIESKQETINELREANRFLREEYSKLTARLLPAETKSSFLDKVSRMNSSTSVWSLFTG